MRCFSNENICPEIEMAGVSLWYGPLARGRCRRHCRQGAAEDVGARVRGRGGCCICRRLFTSSISESCFSSLKDAVADRSGQTLR